ncbi:unnamed protein product [Protopolystoma xenopodis]|uniref:Uncharacterized protein n=1 Tax=Protopolystoma xenopodis TaxID=117903 RepID=A0A3S5A9M2_9PLAT|nr:unnamed protein product [Protopolystoma xenopodis]
MTSLYVLKLHKGSTGFSQKLHVHEDYFTPNNRTELLRVIFASNLHKASLGCSRAWHLPEDLFEQNFKEAPFSHFIVSKSPTPFYMCRHGIVLQCNTLKYLVKISFLRQQLVSDSLTPSSSSSLVDKKVSKT